MKRLIFIFLLLTTLFWSTLFSVENTLKKDASSTDTFTTQKSRDQVVLQHFIMIFTALLLIIIMWIIALKKHNNHLQKVKNELYQLNRTLEKRIKIEVEKNEQNQLLILQQSRIDQIGQTINMIAHQWRQPLNNLALINQILILQYNKYGLDNKAINAFKEDSTTQIEEMSHTISDFKDFFKPDKMEVEFDPKSVIKHAVRLIKPILNSNKIELFIEYRENIKLIGYPNELGQSIGNILNNAKDALIKNNRDKERHIHLNLYAQENAVIITITDNAGGIDPKIINHIFDPYFSTKTQKAGIGLGLYMSKMIIEEHMNGLLTVKNSSNGTIFTITLPLELL